MGNPDVSLKNFFSSKERFADLFNGYLYAGNEVINPEELEMINNESSLIFPDSVSKKRAITRFADVRMKWKREVVLSVLATEFQDEVHYAMPVKNMLLEGLCYTDQMREIWNNIEDENVKNGLSVSEIFSRFRKKDKLVPVISIVFYYGEEWDGSLSLFDMFSFSEETMNRSTIDIFSKYVNNYKINLFNPTKITDYTVFKTDLQIIFGMLQYKKDKNALRRYISDNEDFFSCISYEAANAAGTLLHSSKWFDKAIGKFINKEKEDYDMCEAIEDMINDGRIEGRLEGEIRGKIIAYYDMGCSLEDIAKKMALSVGEVENILNL